MSYLAVMEGLDLQRAGSSGLVSVLLLPRVTSTSSVTVMGRQHADLMRKDATVDRRRLLRFLPDR